MHRAEELHEKGRAEPAGQARLKQSWQGFRPLQGWHIDEMSQKLQPRVGYNGVQRKVGVEVLI